MKCPKMGSNGQIFASLLAEKTVFNHIKHIIVLKETSRNGVVWCIKYLVHFQIFTKPEVCNIIV